VPRSQMLICQLRREKRFRLRGLSRFGSLGDIRDAIVLTSTSKGATDHDLTTGTLMDFAL
jgi:hypothetical protein